MSATCFPGDVSLTEINAYTIFVQSKVKSQNKSQVLKSHTPFTPGRLMDLDYILPKILLDVQTISGLPTWNLYNHKSVKVGQV